MKSEKLGRSETSSEETDQLEAVQNDSAGAKRSYECTFCRRGLTNARALGGHMNIHRKDRAKAKQGTPNSSLPSYFANGESMAPPFIPEFSSQPSRYYSILESHQRNFEMHFQPSVPNPRNPPAHNFQYEFLELNANQEPLLGPHLSLQIGPSHVDADQVRRGIQKDGEILVDLELRLGHDPHSNY